MYVCICIIYRERRASERASERERERERKREREREREKFIDNQRERERERERGSTRVCIFVLYTHSPRSLLMLTGLFRHNRQRQGPVSPDRRVSLGILFHSFIYYGFIIYLFTTTGKDTHQYRLILEWWWRRRCGTTHVKTKRTCSVV
jgi:hypothetical protein